MNYISIDLGKKGIIAISRDDYLKKIDIFKMPLKANEIDKLKLNEILTSCYDDGYCIIEKQSGYFGYSKRSLASVAYQQGIVDTLLLLNKIKILYVTPRQWQKAILGQVKGKKNLKRHSIIKAQELFPELEINNDNVADALNMLYYLRFNMVKI